MITNIRHAQMIRGVTTASFDPRSAAPTSPGPLGTTFASPDLLGIGPATSDPPGKGSALSDPKGVGSVPPDSLERISPRLTRGLRSRPRAGAWAPARGPPPPTTTNARCGPETMPLTLGRGRTRLDVTSICHRLYLLKN
jgi:hypothetical protein